MRNVSGVGFHNSEPRNFNRGFGRGYPRPYQLSQPPPSPQPHRKSDLFVEAGRLAVEYLVSHGLLSSNVLPGKSQDHRNSQDQEISRSPDNGVSSGRRSHNDQDLIISRNYSGEERKYGASKSYSSDWSRENGRVGTLLEKTSSLLAIEVDYEKNPEDSSKKENSKSKVDFSLQGKDNEDLPKSIVEAKDEAKDGTCNHDPEQKIHRDESPIHRSQNHYDVSPKEEMNVTKVHCFLSDKSLKNEPLLISKEMNISDTGHNFHDFVKDDIMNFPSGITPLKNKGVFDLACGVDRLKHVESLSFADKEFPHEQESSSINKDRNEKRALEEDSMTEGAKKARPWLSVAQSNEYLKFSDLSDKKPISPEKRDASICNESNDQESFHIVSLPLEGSIEPAMDRREEKQLFSSEYKICDLNLIEGSDMHENHGVPALLYPSLSPPKKEKQIDIDLSMRNNFSFIGGYSDSRSVRKDVEIIDLGSSSMEEGKGSKFPTKTAEDGMVNFANNPQHTNDNADGQDGYRLMISELLGNDVPSCSAVQPDINSLQDDIGLHHGEGIFTEDDPIYMSLGEIPLSMPDI